MQLQADYLYYATNGGLYGPLTPYEQRVGEGKFETAWTSADGFCWDAKGHPIPVPDQVYDGMDLRKGFHISEFETGGERCFSHERWAALLDETFAEIRSLGAKKGGEYSGDDDRLLNFRRNGAALGLPMETVWAVYAAKHWDAIQQFIKDQRNGKERERLEPIAGRVDDLLVYLLLFKAMLEESGHAG